MCSINSLLEGKRKKIKMKNREESLRQQKVAAQLQRDIGELMLRNFSELSAGGLLSVTKVRMSPDLALAKVYLSIFPFERSNEIVSKVVEAKSQIRGALGRMVRGQLRIVPELAFFVDDSMEYAQNIDRLIKM